MQRKLFAAVLTAVLLTNTVYTGIPVYAAEEEVTEDQQERADEQDEITEAEPEMDVVDEEEQESEETVSESESTVDGDEISSEEVKTDDDQSELPDQTDDAEPVEEEQLAEEQLTEEPVAVYAEPAESKYDADFSNIPAKATSFGKFSTMLDWHASLPDTDKLYKAGDGTISWNATEKKLILDNATVNIEMNGNGAIQLPSGQSVTVELIGDNVFTEIGSDGGVYQSQGFFNTYGNLTFAGDGSLTMKQSSMGMRVNTGASIIFNQTGTIEIEARNCGIQSQGDITVNSGKLLVSASMTGGNVWGIYMISSTSTATNFVMNDGYVEIHADYADGNNSGALYAVNNRNSKVAFHGGEILATAAQEAIRAGYEVITIDGTAKVTAKSQKNTALGNSKVSGNAVVNAETESGSYAAYVQEIHDHAQVTGSGYMGGVSISWNTFALTDAAVIISKGETAQHGSMSNDLQYAIKMNKLDGCKITVDTDKSGETATVWDWDLTAHPLNNSTYKYVKIEKCDHTGAKDDGDCTTPVICPDCGGKTVLLAAQSHDYGTEWTNEENGVHNLLCTNKLYHNEQCKEKKTVTAPDVIVTYDGNAHGIVVTAPDGADIQYKNDGTYTSTNPSYTDVGTYTVEYQVKGLGADLISSAKVTIQPRKITPTAELDPTSYIYDGEAKEPTVILKNGEDIIPVSHYTVEYQNNTEVGEATAIIKAVPGLNETFDDITVPFSIVYRVTLSTAGGTLDTDMVLTDANGKIINIKTPVREGYTFAGWFWDAELQNAFNYETDRISEPDITLYAKWVVNSKNTSSGKHHHSSHNNDSDAATASAGVENTTPTGVSGANTGDSSSPVLWSVLSVIAALCGAVIYRKRKQL